MPSTASSTGLPAAGSASAAAYALIASTDGGSGLPRLVDVGLLRHARFVVFLFGTEVDVPVPEQRTAALLLVLEGRALGLHRFDEGGDVGGVRLPEPGHGVGGSERVRV